MSFDFTEIIMQSFRKHTIENIIHIESTTLKKRGHYLGQKYLYDIQLQV